MNTAERRVPRCAIQKREVRPMCETSHRPDRINPVQFANVHQAYVTNDGGRAERDSPTCGSPSLSFGTSTLLNSTVRI